MPPDPNVHVGVCAWTVHRDSVLMLQRGGVGEFASDGYGKWTAPGGWLDFGETPFEAAERESREEAGVHVEAVHADGFVNNISENGEFQIVTLFIICRYVAGEPTVTEPVKCMNVQWMPRARVRAKHRNGELFAPVTDWLA